jgi:hypothetical protein
MSAGEDLCKIDHAVGSPCQADAGETEIAFDITAVTGAMEPAIDHFAGAHGTGGNVLRCDVDGSEAFAEAVNAIAKTIMSEGGLTRQHVPAMAECNGRDKGISLQRRQVFGMTVFVNVTEDIG